MTRRRFLLSFLAVPLSAGLAATVTASSERKGKRASSKQPPVKPLDLNRATAEELEQVPGIGPVTARSIVTYREKNGAFRRLEELMIIRGISEEKLDKLRPWLAVGK